MCGIAGILDLDERKVEAGSLERLCDRLVHRGPDEEGYYLDTVAGLGQRRLSIIDLAGGHQPLANEDGTVWVTFNGEIYNFHELRVTLEGHGHRFATHSDTEVIVHAYEQYGPDCVEHFRGMFAFAVWDANRRTLFLARDRVGKKPLFYAVAGGQFVFASELQALVQHPSVSREVDPAALDDYLTYGYIPAPGTVFRGVSKLPPAHRLTLRLAKGGANPADIRVERYWRLAYAPKLKLTEEEAVEGVLEVLEEAVRLRLIADVPLGALLSGGVDSGVVVALMSRLSSGPVKTFSIGFQEQAFNELPYARLVARHCGTDHHELIVRPSALEVLPTLVRHYGEPFADSSAVPSYYVSRLTRHHVKVALNGDGGDECFAGYERYLGSAVAERYRSVPALLRRGIDCLASALIPDSLPRRSRLRQTKRFLQAAALPTAPRYLRWVTYFTPEQKKELYAPEFAARLGGRDAGRWLLDEFDAARAGGGEPLDHLLAVDVASYLPYDLLVKMDIATMANSLEARSPFLDHKVLEFAARLPAHFKVRRATLKYVLKKAAERLLPAECLYRRKMGFGVPVGEWMRGELRPLLEDTLLAPGARTAGYFRPAALRRLLRQHAEGRQDYAFHLWALLWLELWHREFHI
jgi:asparagine synthase (glutamine-hydrolysing)